MCVSEALKEYCVLNGTCRDIACRDIKDKVLGGEGVNSGLGAVFEQGEVLIQNQQQHVGMRGAELL